MKNNEKKRWGRRLGSVIGATLLITVAYYIVMFKGLELAWWSEYAKYTAYFLGFLVGALSATDIINKMKS